MRKALVVFSALLAASGLLGHRAKAAETIEGPIFQMANGSFYHVASGKTAPTREALIALLNPSAPVPPIVSSSSTMPPVPVEKPVPAMRQAVARAKVQLEERLAAKGHNASLAGLTGKTGEWWPVSLAIWNEKTDEIVVREFLRSSFQLRTPAGTAESEVRVVRANGVNSEYETKTDGLVVVANTHPIFTTSGKTTKVSEVVYTPYSQALHTPDMVAWGADFLNEVVDGVYADLRASGVPSSAFPDKLLADVVDEDVVKSIAVIEHAEFTSLKQDPKRVTEAFFVTIAGNDKDTYAYSRSSAGALGLVQFIPKTYNWLVARRPSLKLNPDFEKGMRDPKNAIKSQVAYLDILITEMPEVKKMDLVTNRELVNEYLVAAYNGGSGRVRRSIAEWEDAVQGRQAAKQAALEVQNEKLIDEIEALKVEIKKTKVAATLKKMNKELASLRATRADILAKITTYEKFSLRAETRQYVLKYRQALPILRGFNAPIQVAATVNLSGGK